jgi:hypothetical protein
MQQHKFTKFWSIPPSLCPDHRDDFCLFGRWMCSSPDGLIYCMDCRCRHLVCLNLRQRDFSIVATIPDHYTTQYLAYSGDGSVWMELTSQKADCDSYLARFDTCSHQLTMEFNISEYCRHTHQYILGLINDRNYQLWIATDDTLCRIDRNTDEQGHHHYNLIPVSRYPANMTMYYRLTTGETLVGWYSENFRLNNDPYKLILRSPQGQEIFGVNQAPDMCLNVKVMEASRSDNSSELYLMTTSYPGYHGNNCRLYRLLLTPPNQISYEAISDVIQPRILVCDYVSAYRAILGFRHHDLYICPVDHNYIPSLQELCLDRVQRLDLPRHGLTQDLQDILQTRDHSVESKP